jgi:hypothetical protein
MNDLNWEAEFNILAQRHDCSDSAMRGRPSKKAIKNRKELEKAFAAVKSAAKENPGIEDSELLKKKVYSFLFPGVFSFLIPILISVLMRIVIEHLIDKLFSSGSDYGGGEEIICK